MSTLVPLKLCCTSTWACCEYAGKHYTQLFNATGYSSFSNIRDSDVAAAKVQVLETDYWLPGIVQYLNQEESTDSTTGIIIHLFTIYSNVSFFCRGHTDAVLCLQFDEEKVVSGSKDKTIKVCLYCKLGKNMGGVCWGLAIHCKWLIRQCIVLSISATKVSACTFFSEQVTEF